MKRTAQLTHVTGVRPAGFYASPKQLALRCLADCRNDPDRAVALAGRYAHGHRLREVITAISNAWLGTASTLNNSKLD
jgi:hypothetical protein